MEQTPAILLQPYAAAYIDIAKVASSSLKATFGALLGLDLTEVEGNPHLVSFPSPGTPDLGRDRLFPDLCTFSFVRNPWDRLVSCYRDKIGGQVADFTGMADSGVAHCLAGFDVFNGRMEFEAFVTAVAEIPDEDADEHFRSQHCSVTNTAGEVAIDFVGHFENLASDFARVAGRIGLPVEAKLPRLQANPVPTAYTDFYNPRTRDLVARRFAKDIDLFEYRFEEG